MGRVGRVKATRNCKFVPPRSTYRGKGAREVEREREEWMKEGREGGRGRFPRSQIMCERGIHGKPQHSAWA